MDKQCIFCGQPPEKKNKEHVLPRWLLEFTGDPNRTTKIGYDWSTGKALSFSYNSLVFPACESCNSRYSKLEGEVKTIIEKIFKYDYLDTYDFTVLLDWFDKIRIGLWIGNQYLSKNAFGVNPKFHIDQRIRKKDRFVIINDLNNHNMGLTLIGVNSPFFHYYPTCFTILINNKVFTNVSSDFVASHNIGMPYPKIGYLSSDNPMTEFELLKGKLKLNKRLLRFPILQPYFIFGQPIANELIIKHRNDLYSEEYVRNFWQVRNEGVGKIFFEKNGILELMDEGDEIQIDLRPEVRSGKLGVVMQTIKLQNFLYEHSIISDEKLTQEHKKNYREYGKIIREFNSSALTRINP